MSSRRRRRARRRQPNSVVEQLRPPSGYQSHLVRGAASAIAAALTDYVNGRPFDVTSTLMQGVGEAAVSYAQEMGFDEDKKRALYNQRASKAMSAHTEAMTRLGKPMAECDECGDTMSQPSLESIDDPSNYRTLWVLGNNDDDGDIYFLCSATCHRKRRVQAVRDGFRVR